MQMQRTKTVYKSAAISKFISRKQITLTPRHFEIHSLQTDTTPLLSYTDTTIRLNRTALIPTGGCARRIKCSRAEAERAAHTLATSTLSPPLRRQRLRRQRLRRVRRNAAAAGRRRPMATSTLGPPLRRQSLRRQSLRRKRENAAAAGRGRPMAALQRPPAPTKRPATYSRPSNPTAAAPQHSLVEPPGFACFLKWRWSCSW